MQIGSIDNASFVSLAVVEVENVRFSSRRFAVEVKIDSDFGGRDEDVWIEDEVFAQFLGQLEALESSRSGSGRLEAMSPDDFVLQIESVDSAGHMMITTKLGKCRRVGRGLQRVGVEGVFEVDSGALRAILDDLRKLTLARLMKVRCVDDRPFLQERDGGLVVESKPGKMISLTKGGLYDVLSVERGWYRVVDDTGEDFLYPPELFEVVVEM